MKQLTTTELKRLHRRWRKDEPGRLALLLEGLGSPFNLGAIFRTAAACLEGRDATVRAELKKVEKDLGAAARVLARYGLKP